MRRSRSVCVRLPPVLLQARAFQFTAVEEEKMQAGQPSDAELQAMHEVMKYVKQFSKSGNVITNKFKAAPPRPRRSGKFSTAPPRKTVEEKKTAVPTGKSRRPKGSAVQWPADMYLVSYLLCYVSAATRTSQTESSSSGSRAQR
mmetsp:Transcript_44162/g.104623  ORF Transcript_44162/g.104623 Transcript_44162/m.104623 type:complete len:144 (+) Transcript_44162:1053-1484(+)